MSSNLIGNVPDKFIAPLRVHFGDPTVPRDAGGPDAFFDSVTLELGHFSNMVLEFAAKKLMTTRTTKGFPPLAECLAVCKAVMEEFARSDRPKRTMPRRKPEKWERADVVEADRLFCNFSGSQKALDEGYGWGLWDFMREQGRWPNGHELADLRANSLALNADYAVTLSSGQHNPIIQRLNRIREFRLNKLQALLTSAAKMPLETE